MTSWRVVLAVALGSHAGCSDDPADDPPFAFARHVVDPAYRAEGVAVFDVDHDGLLDIVTSELWYRAPDFAPHEIRAPRAWDPLTEYAETFGAFHLDVDADGYDDVVLIGEPGGASTWCADPQGADRHWACHPVAAQESGESPMLAELFRDGRLVLVTAIEPDLVMGWMTPDDPVDQPWVMHAVTPPGFPQAGRYEHGLGIGDLNRDLRYDIVTGSGWLEQPVDPADRPWPWHPATICPNNCSHLAVYDIDGDGLQDLIGTSPHGYGVWWFQQRAGQPGEDPIFIEHEIDRSISQTHAARFVDLDGDRVPELVTGKRWYAHFTADPGALEPAYLVAYRMIRSAGVIDWERIELDDDSGVGTQFEVVDVSGDGKPDIVVANKKGVMYFEQE